MKLLIILCLGILVITGCKLNSEKLAEIKKQAVLDSLQRQQNIERIKEIKRKYPFPDFHYLYDDFTNIGYYDIETKFDYHKRPWAKLTLRIDNEGAMYFNSVYCGDERLYHTRLAAKIGDSLIVSQEVPLGDRFNIVEAEYVETVYFTHKDNGILNAIASSRDDENIRIRLLGDREFTFTLNKSDIIKLKEGCEFARLIKSVKLSAKQQDRIGY